MWPSRFESTALVRKWPAFSPVLGEHLHAVQLVLSHSLLSRAGTAFAVAHDWPSNQYCLLYENQCLINTGCLDVVVLFFFPGSASC